MSKTLRARKSMRRRTRKAMRKSTRKSMRRRTGKQRVGGLGEPVQTSVETGNTNETGKKPSLLSTATNVLSSVASVARNNILLRSPKSATAAPTPVEHIMVENVKVGDKVIVTADDKLITSKHDTNYDKYLMPTEFNSFDIYFDKGNPELVAYYNGEFYVKPDNPRDDPTLWEDYTGNQILYTIKYKLKKILFNDIVNMKDKKTMKDEKKYESSEPKLKYARELLSRLLKKDVKDICDADMIKFIERHIDRLFTLKEIRDTNKFCISINNSTWFNEEDYGVFNVKSPLRFMLTINNVDPNAVEPNNLQVITFKTDTPNSNDMFTNYNEHLGIKYFSEIKLTAKPQGSVDVKPEKVVWTSILRGCADREASVEAAANQKYAEQQAADHQRTLNMTPEESKKNWQSNTNKYIEWQQMKQKEAGRDWYGKPL